MNSWLGWGKLEGLLVFGQGQVVLLGGCVILSQQKFRSIGIRLGVDDILQAL
jgi:hypothetical protein